MQLQASFDQCSFDALLSGITQQSNPHYNTFVVMLVIAFLCFVISTLSKNYSQVDKIWSITPFVFTWFCVRDQRTLLMACLATFWGLRLTWNFNRRGGYHFPNFWSGEEDYRWPALRGGIVPYFGFLKEPIPWVIFNIIFISFFQNLLLLLIASPSLVAWTVASKACMTSSADVVSSSSPLNVYDLILTVVFLLLVLIESLADNAQFKFQTEKYRKINAKEKLTGDYLDGFNQSGLYAVFRKPNYFGEQGLWVTFYLFSVSATGGKMFNWSIIGSILLLSLFQGSGWITERLTEMKYPKYKVYRERVDRYLPFKGLYYMFMDTNSNKKKM